MVDNTKMNIEINNHINKNDTAYITVGFKGGFAVKEYLINDNNYFVGNYSFCNVLFNYWRLTNKFLTLNYDVLRVSSILSFKVKNNKCVETLSTLLKEAFDFDYNKEIFEQAKDNTKSAFANRYKDEAFRAKYKAFEYSDLNKGFALKALIDDLDSVDYSTFVDCSKKILVPSNISVYISGDSDKITNCNMGILEESIPKVNDTISFSHRVYDPYLRQDAHIIELARKNYNLTVLAFDFLNSNITVFTKQLVLSILSERLPYRDIDLSADINDASLMFENESLEPVKPLLKDTLTSQEFARIKKKLLTKYAVMLSNQLELLGAEAVSFANNGIQLAEYLKFIDTCDYKGFLEVCTNADFKISEAQVVMKREVK